MVTGLELVVGFLIAWAARKAQRVGQKTDHLIDSAIDASFERLHQVIVGKLAEEPSLKRLEEDAANGVAVSSRTQQRVTLALEDAAEDRDFAAELETAIKAVQAAQAAVAGQQLPIKLQGQNSTNYGTQVNTAGDVIGSTIVGSVAGSITFDQSEPRREPCFCGMEVCARCPACNEWVCRAHFVEAGRTIDYAIIDQAVTQTEGGRFIRSNPAYHFFMAQGSNGCITCRVKNADRLINERTSWLNAWLREPRKLTCDEFIYVSALASLLDESKAVAVLRYSFHLFQPTMKIVRLSAGGHLSSGEEVVTLGQSQFAPEYFVAKSGNSYAKSLREYASDHTSLSIVVHPWETPKLIRKGDGVRFGLTGGGSRLSTDIVVEPCTDFATIFHRLQGAIVSAP